MNKELRIEIKNLIQELGLNCEIEDFKNKMTNDMWKRISLQRKLSESFMEEYFDVLDKELISRSQILSESFMEEHFDELYEENISWCQILSESFMKKHFYELDKIGLSHNQRLSESLMEEHFDELDKSILSWRQKLSESLMEEHFDEFDVLDKRRLAWNQKMSEPFMEKHFDELNKHEISLTQKMSETFIEKYFHAINKEDISESQVLSEYFMEKHKNELNIEIQLKKHHAKKSKSAVHEYAQKHGLRIEDGYLYAFRNHDQFGRGAFNKTIFYEKGGVYRDWHCDLDPESEDSFGLGIWPKGNIPIRVKLKDFGVAVKNDNNGKARVWEFEVL